MTNFPEGADHVEELQLEKHDAMYCDKTCIPTCDATIYYAQPISADLVLR